MTERVRRHRRGGQTFRGQTFICSGYEPGITTLTAAPATTPDCEPHEPHPDGYVAHSEWADMMMKTHEVRQCRGCGLWAIWEPKEATAAGGGRREPA